MEELHNWLFHYNPYTKIWSAFKREDLVAYFNGENSKALQATKHSVLVELITLTGGDEKKIKGLLDHGTRFSKKISQS